MVAKSTGDGVKFTFVGSGKLIGGVLAHAVNNKLAVMKEKIDLALIGCFIGSNLL